MEGKWTCLMEPLVGQHLYNILFPYNVFTHFILPNCIWLCCMQRGMLVRGLSRAVCRCTMATSVRRLALSTSSELLCRKLKILTSA